MIFLDLPIHGVIEVPFWIGDADTIDLYNYTAPIATPAGIDIYFNDFTPGLGADISWCQMACALPDGSAGTYGVTGEDFYTPDLSASTTLVCAALGGDDVELTVVDSTSFVAGDYIKIGSSLSTAETVSISSIPSSTQIIVNMINYDHYPGETVFTDARKIWLKVTVPVGAADGQAINYINVGIGKRYIRSSKL